jgi:hypothetical protein
MIKKLMYQRDKMVKKFMENIVTDRLIIRKFEQNDWQGYINTYQIKKLLNLNHMIFIQKISLKKKQLEGQKMNLSMQFA